MSGAVCEFDGCDTPHYSKGFCTKHYQRWKRFGDPAYVKLKMPPKGEPKRFFEEIILPYKGEDCIAWPYAKTPAGYGQIWWEGRLQVVSRLACTMIHGEPPSPNLDAAHSCGNGHLGCSNPNHLSWKTRAENVADMIMHGTENFFGRKN